MLKLYVGLVYVFLTNPCVLAQRRNNSSKRITANPFSNILSKFHQSDYKFAYEWSDVVRVDKTYVDFYKRPFKYNRTVTAVNATFVPNLDVGYDVEIIAQAYRFASNEYRLYPIRFQFNLCEALATRAMGFDKFATQGNFTCPILKGKRYHYYNWTPEYTRFPPFIPTGKYTLELQFLYHSKEFLVTRDYGSIYRPFV